MKWTYSHLRFELWICICAISWFINAWVNTTIGWCLFKANMHRLCNNDNQKYRGIKWLRTIITKKWLKNVFHTLTKKEFEIIFKAICWWRSNNAWICCSLGASLSIKYCTRNTACLKMKLNPFVWLSKSVTKLGET